VQQHVRPIDVQGCVPRLRLISRWRASAAVEIANGSSAVPQRLAGSELVISQSESARQDRSSGSGTVQPGARGAGSPERDESKEAEPRKAPSVPAARSSSRHSAPLVDAKP
jgi:hypothetical protein